MGELRLPWRERLPLQESQVSGPGPLAAEAEYRWAEGASSGPSKTAGCCCRLHPVSWGHRVWIWGRVCRALVPIEEKGQEGIREGQTKMLKLLLRDQNRSRFCQVDSIPEHPRLKEHLYRGARAAVMTGTCTGVNGGTLCRGEWCW